MAEPKPLTSPLTTPTGPGTRTPTPSPSTPPGHGTTPSIEQLALPTPDITPALARLNQEAHRHRQHVASAGVGRRQVLPLAQTGRTLFQVGGRWHELPAPPSPAPRPPTNVSPPTQGGKEEAVFDPLLQELIAAQAAGKTEGTVRLPWPGIGLDQVDWHWKKAPTGGAKHVWVDELVEEEAGTVEGPMGPLTRSKTYGPVTILVAEAADCPFILWVQLHSQRIELFKGGALIETHNSGWRVDAPASHGDDPSFTAQVHSPLGNAGSAQLLYDLPGLLVDFRDWHDASRFLAATKSVLYESVGRDEFPPHPLAVAKLARLAVALELADRILLTIWFESYAICAKTHRILGSYAWAMQIEVTASGRTLERQEPRWKANR